MKKNKANISPILDQKFIIIRTVKYNVLIVILLMRSVLF